MAPLRIVFKVDNMHYGLLPSPILAFESFLISSNSGKNEFSVIFKLGDDLRQDQLVVQLISLMDRLLKKENLDLNLIIYKVVPFS